MKTGSSKQLRISFMNGLQVQLLLFKKVSSAHLLKKEKGMAPKHTLKTEFYQHLEL
jgi:hypothetical protein